VTNVFFFQKVIPHYRLALFRALHRTFGWKVLTAETPPDPKGLLLSSDEPFVERVSIQFFRNDLNYPMTGLSLLDHLPGPISLISEFSLRFPLTYLFAAARHTGRIKRLAFHTHGQNLTHPQGSPVAFLSDSLRIQLFKAADVVATYTSSGERWINHIAPGVKTVTIENTIDISHARTVAAASKAQRLGYPQLLFCARLSPEKKAPLLMELFDRLAPRYPDLRLIVIGSGNEHDKLSEMRQRRNNDHRIVLLGSVYEEEQLAPWFLGSDLFIIPGHGGLSINHALAHGLPVIAFSDSRGSFHAPEIEYVQHGLTGRLVDPQRGIDGMADEISMLLDDPAQLESMRSAIPGFVDERLQIATMVRNFGCVDVILRS
jgi:glycosyltransferase involved in cell wall biosynthesis